MANNRFEILLIEHIKEFVSAFSNTSKELFESDGHLGIHPGEFGIYREQICRNFLKMIMPSNFDISTGFLINESGETSTQVDLIIYEPSITPLLKTKEMIRFFPVESVVGIGEVKSDLNKSQFREVLNKLAKNKMMRDDLKSPSIIKSEYDKYSPNEYASDLLFSFLICQKFSFENDNLAKIINDLYDGYIGSRFRHNLILSIDDGLLCYFHDINDENIIKVKEKDKSRSHKTGDRVDIYYSFHKNTKYKNRFIKPAENRFAHFKKFATYFYQGIMRTTLLYPEISNYMKRTPGGRNLDEDVAY